MSSNNNATSQRLPPSRQQQAPAPSDYPPHTEEVVQLESQRHHRRHSSSRSSRSRDSRTSGSGANTTIPLLVQQQQQQDGGGGGGGYITAANAGYGTASTSPYGQYQQHQYTSSAGSTTYPPVPAAVYYGRQTPYLNYSSHSGNAPPQQVAYGYYPYQQQQRQPPVTRTSASPSVDVGQHHQQQQHQDSATALSMEDIEYAFHSALSTQFHPLLQQQQQLEHPLKREKQRNSDGGIGTSAGGGGGGGYGSIPPNSPRALRRLSSSRSSSQNKPLLSISTGGSGAPPSSSTSTSLSPQKKKKNFFGRHRRVSSDTPLRSHPLRRHASSEMANTNKAFRQGGGAGASSSKGLSVGTDSLLHQRQRYLRVRSYSGGESPANKIIIDNAASLLPLLSKNQKPPTHRRVSSYNSIGASASFRSSNSVATDRSHVSVVSDIRKSTFFGGYNQQTGDAELLYPISQVHLVLVKNDESISDSDRHGNNYYDNDDDTLSLGKVYGVPIPNCVYEDYHQFCDDKEQDLEDGFGMSPPGAGVCTCGCPACCNNSRYGNNTGKPLLPPNFYVMTVPDDLYRRVLDEICDAKSMPCGIFFCGHHEDVSRPSIWIPVVAVFILIGGMGLAAYLLQTTP